MCVAYGWWSVAVRIQILEGLAGNWIKRKFTKGKVGTQFAGGSLFLCFWFDYGKSPSFDYNLTEPAVWDSVCYQSRECLWQKDFSFSFFFLTSFLAEISITTNWAWNRSNKLSSSDHLWWTPKWVIQKAVYILCAHNGVFIGFTPVNVWIQWECVIVKTLKPTWRCSSKNHSWICNMFLGKAFLWVPFVEPWTGE